MCGGIDVSKKTVKYIINIAIIILLAAGTLYFLLRGSEIKVVFSKIAEADLTMLFIAAAFVVGYVCTESMIIRYLFMNLRVNISLAKCILVSNVGFFFCGITPGASGGQPMQIFYLTKFGVDPLVSTLVIIVVTICYKLTLVLFTILFFIIRPGAMFEAIGNVPILFGYGIFTILFLIVLLSICVFKPAVGFRILSKLISLGGKLHLVKNPDRALSKTIHSIRQYEKASLFIKNNPKMIVGAMGLTFIQRLLYFSVTFVILNALHLDCNWFDIIAFQIIMALAVDALPLPGASGANETVFKIIYGVLYGDVAMSALILNRGITYYFMMLFTLVFTIVAHIVSMRLSEKNKTLAKERVRHVRVFTTYVRDRKLSKRGNKE